MTTITVFSPSATANPPFQFQPTLDGAQYVVTTTFNIFGNRWYINVSDLSGNLILARPMVGSPTKIQASITWADWLAVASLDAAHNIPIGAVANIEVSDTGLTYDGTWSAWAVDAMTLAFTLQTDPGQYGITGNVSQDVNLIANTPSSYDSNGNPLTFFSSSLVFRFGQQQFEVSP
jgi:hypothetical protein